MDAEEKLNFPAPHLCLPLYGGVPTQHQHELASPANSFLSPASPGLKTMSSKYHRSINAPNPETHFGPKGSLREEEDCIGEIIDPVFHQLTWNKAPQTVMIVKKPADFDVSKCFKSLTKWLVQEKGLKVYVEEKSLNEGDILQDEAFAKVKSAFVLWKEGQNIDNEVDFVICLGGDGTLLYTSSIFQGSCPPVMAFHLGSLGFLTPFLFDNFKTPINNVIDGQVGLTLRSRLKCEIIKEGGEKEARFLVLNEVVVDRGPSSYLCNLDIFCNQQLITSVQGDGMIVSTPTGSTAYAVAAGASMVHPSVPTILLTPVCPHSLSFRPIMMPAGVEVKIMVCRESRNSAWVSFDGKNRHELVQGKSVRITTSQYPVPCITRKDQISDWFSSLAECLHWNVRRKQRHMSITDCHV